MNERNRSDWLGATIGFVTFLGGVALLLFTFKLAYDMFSVSPEKAVGITKDNAVDIAKAGESLASIAMRILLLLVMSGVGSMVANRGIKLYVSARSLTSLKPEAPTSIEHAESTPIP